MNHTLIHPSNLQNGDIVYVRVMIDPTDLVPTQTAALGELLGRGESTHHQSISSPSSFSSSISVIAGRPTFRFCDILDGAGTGSLKVTYLATFHSAASLPVNLDALYWYPVAPAQPSHAQLSYPPLPILNGIKQWVSLRKTTSIDVTGLV